MGRCEMKSCNSVDVGARSESATDDCSNRPCGLRVGRRLGCAQQGISLNNIFIRINSSGGK
ncbi:Unknown protein sequence [Pseudomonas coronafaciens pv. oryzae]|nr:Unknown protein sequence [Pseudomonas coronafaciens pv. oryzae]